MTRPVPIVYRCEMVDVADADGVVRTVEAMVPIRRFEPAHARQYKLGEHYMLSPEEHGSTRSRRHYFACLRSAWQSLPENVAHRYPSITHLRKTALIKAGFRSERHHACKTYDEALALGALVKEVDEFVVTVIHPGNVLSIYTAKSQSSFAMRDDEFQASKVAVLALVAGLIGVTPAELGRNPHPDEGREVERNPDHSLDREPVGAPAARPSLPPPAGGERAAARRAPAAAPKNGEAR